MKKTFLLAISLFAAIAVQAQHTVVLKNGEKITGMVESMSNGIISLKSKGKDMKLKVAEVSAVYFDEKAATAAASASAGGKTMETKSASNVPGEKTITSGSYTVRYKCGPRTIVKAPVISNLQEDKGTVVVDITIDKYGHVMKATPGGEGTTTDSEYLKTKAKQAAESAIFDNVPTAPLETKGYITITF